MWLVWAFDAVLLVLPIGREQLRDLIYVGRPDTPKRPSCVADGLTDLELVITHTTLLLFASHRAPPPRRNSIVHRAHGTTKAIILAGALLRQPRQRLKIAMTAATSTTITPATRRYGDQVAADEPRQNTAASRRAPRRVYCGSPADRSRASRSLRMLLMRSGSGTASA